MVLSRKSWLFFNTNLRAGGAERHLVQLLKFWPEPGDELHLLLMERQGIWVGALPYHVQLRALSPSMPGSRWKRPWWALSLLPALRRSLQTYPVSAVLTFLWVPTLALALTHSRRPLPVVWSVQSDLEYYRYTHRDASLRLFLARRWIPRVVTRYIATSRGMARKIQKLFGIPEHRIRVIPNCIDLQEIRRKSRNEVGLPRRGMLRLVSVGRLHKVKGHDVLLRAVALLPGPLKEKLEVIMVGDGPERPRLEKLASTLGLGQRVHWVGFTPNPYPWMRSADLFVLPSRRETFGIAVAEAMTLGTPVVATTTDGPLDLIRHGHTGWLVPPGDAEALARALDTLLTSPDLRKRLGRHGRAVAQQLDAPRIARMYRDVLAEAESSS